MAYPQLPIYVAVAFPITFLAIAMFTNARYSLSPSAYISHSVTIAALAVGFVFLYALQKYDTMDGNFPVVIANIIYLTDIALEHEPSTICFLIQYLWDYLNYDNTGYPILMFEREIAPFINEPPVIERTKDAVTNLEQLYYQRISRENLIPAPVWYIVFFIASLLTIIFALDNNIESKIDAVIIIILIWFPVIVIYIMYLSIIQDLDQAIMSTIFTLEEITVAESVCCANVLDDERNNSGIVPRNPIVF